MTFTDQLNRTIQINFPPKKIVSLVPSQSELLWDLGLQEEVAGITKFCIHPEEMFRSVKRIGGTKAIKIDEIIKLQPDLVIANKEENEQAQIEELAKHCPVWISDIYTLTDALDMMKQVGEITGRKDRSLQLIHEIKDLKTSFVPYGGKNNKAVYLIWKPYMAAGKNTFIDDMLSLCGFENAIKTARYPELSIEALQAAKPGLVFLSSEPYPFKEKHIEELQQHLPHSNILLVDGEMFSWYGSRLKKAFGYFEKLIGELENN